MTNARRSKSADSRPKSYVFGSSTPRDLSYLDHLPLQYRLYDSKFPANMRRSRRDEAEEADGRSPSRGRHGRQASTERKGTAGNHPFGSATPREFSYLETLQYQFRVYDVKLMPVNGGEQYHKPRSKTAMSLSTTSTYLHMSCIKILYIH